MQLHDPAALRVFPGEEGEHLGFQQAELLDGHIPPVGGERGPEGFVRRVGIGLDVERVLVEAVVRGPAPHGIEEIDPAAEGFFQRIEIGDRDPRRRAEPLVIRRKPGLVDVEGLVRAERGEHLRREAVIRSEHFVVFERIRRVVGRAEELDPGPGDQGPHAERGFREHLGRRLPDRVRGRLGEDVRDPEEALELEVGPVIERIADEGGHDLRVGEELVVVGGVARDEFLRYAAGAHRAPFIVVAAEPEFGDVRDLPVLGDLLRGDVAVVIDDRELFRVAVIEHLRGLVRQKEIPSHKVLHGFTSVPSPPDGDFGFIDSYRYMIQ